MSKVFDELKQDFSFTERELPMIQRLRKKPEWEAFTEAVDRYILKLTYNRLVGTEIEKEARYEELDKLRGFVHIWNIFTRGINQLKDEKVDSE